MSGDQRNPTRSPSRRERYQLQQQLAQIAIAIQERYPGLISRGIRSGYTVGDLGCVLIEMAPPGSADDPEEILGRIHDRPTGHHVRLGPMRKTGRSAKKTGPNRGPESAGRLGG